DATSTLVWIDQILLAGRAFVVDGDVVELNRLEQRNLPGIMTDKCSLQFGRDPFLQFLRLVRPDLGAEREYQPAADAIRHAERAAELRRSWVETAVDVDLLVDRGAVAAIGCRPAIDRGFHAEENSSRERASTHRVEGQGRAGGHQRLCQIVVETRGSRIAHVERP